MGKLTINYINCHFLCRKLLVITRPGIPTPQRWISWSHDEPHPETSGRSRCRDRRRWRCHVLTFSQLVSCYKKAYCRAEAHNKYLYNSDFWLSLIYIYIYVNFQCRCPFLRLSISMRVQTWPFVPCPSFWWPVAQGPHRRAGENSWRRGRHWKTFALGVGLEHFLVVAIRGFHLELFGCRLHLW